MWVLHACFFGSACLVLLRDLDAPESLFSVADYEKIIKNIEKGEARIQRKEEIRRAIGRKMMRCVNPWLDMKIQYGTNKGKYYTEEADRFMVSGNTPCSGSCRLHQLSPQQSQHLQFLL